MLSVSRTEVSNFYKNARIERDAIILSVKGAVIDATLSGEHLDGKELSKRCKMAFKTFQQTMDASYPGEKYEDLLSVLYNREASFFLSSCFLERQLQELI